MSTPTELFIAAELPKRPYTDTFPFAAGKTLITTGVGLEVVAGDAPGEYLDNAFRIKDNDDTTKKIAFQASGIATGEERTITMPDADIDLGKVPTGVTPTYATGRLMVPLADGTSIPLSAFGGTRLPNLNSPATVLAANGHYLFYSNTGSYYTVICALVLPTAPDDMTYVRISNISSLYSFAADAGATVAPGGSDKINGVAATFSITDYLVNYRNAVITLTYSAFSENWTVSVLGDLIRPRTIAIYDADKTNSTTLTPVADLTTNRVITLPDADVNLGKVSQAASTSTDGYLTSTDWTTFNGKQAALGNVITANTYGSSTQYPIVTVNAKGIVTGVTLQTVVSPAVFSDSAFRIQDNADANKILAFEVSGIVPNTTGSPLYTPLPTTRTITMPNADVDLGQMAKGSFTPVELLASSATQTLAPNYSYYLPAYYAGALNLEMPTSAAIGTTFDIGSIYSNGIDGTIGVNLTALNLTVPAGEYITGWGGAPNPINLLVSYVTNYAGYTTPNFTHGCTFRLTKTGATSWAIKPTFGSALPQKFIVKNEGSGGTIVNTTVPSGTYRELTLPDADVDLGNLSSVATTDFNTLSGTRNRILGGSGNTVSGTDNIAIGTKDFMLSSHNQVAIGAGYRSGNNIERVTCADTLIFGNEAGYALTVVHRLRALGGLGNGVFVVDTTNTPLNQTLTLTNTPKAVLKRSYFLNARHELTFTATVYSSVGVKAGTISGVRVFGVHYGVGSTTDDVGDYVVTSVTPYADLVNGNCSALITASIVEVSGTKEKLLRIHIQAKNAAGTSDYLCNSTAELISHYRLF